jgi:branched-subunit amino acid ABC-type transport system permease component
MKMFNILLTIVFLIFALLQSNDPDPYIWIPIYMLAAFLCWQSTKNKYPGYLYAIGILICIVYGTYLFFDKNGVLSWANDHASESLVHTMKADKPWIEESREFGGLLIVLVVLLINYFLIRKTKTGKNLPASD